MLRFSGARQFSSTSTDIAPSSRVAILSALMKDCGGDQVSDEYAEDDEDDQLGGDHHAVVAHAVPVEHAQVEEICVRGNAPERPEGSRLRRRASVARRDAGYVGPVAVIVILDPANKILPVHHARL